MSRLTNEMEACIIHQSSRARGEEKGKTWLRLSRGPPVLGAYGSSTSSSLFFGHVPAAPAVTTARSLGLDQDDRNPATSYSGWLVGEVL